MFQEASTSVKTANLQYSRISQFGKISQFRKKTYHRQIFYDVRLNSNHITE